MLIGKSEVTALNQKVGNFFEFSSLSNFRLAAESGDGVFFLFENSAIIKIINKKKKKHNYKEGLLCGG